MQRDVYCDVVVIGGGITGPLEAQNLTEAGVKTLVLDKRDIGTSASTALLQYEIDVPLRELVKKVGHEDADAELSFVPRGDWQSGQAGKEAEDRMWL